MNKPQLKRKILEAIRKQKKDLYDTIRRDALARLKSANEEDETGFQNQLESKQEEMYEEYERESKQLDHLQVALDKLDGISPGQIHEEIQFGSVIFTNKLNFFVSVSQNRFPVEDKMIVGISTDAPIYKAMEGMQAGQKFTFNQIDYEIQQVF